MIITSIYKGIQEFIKAYKGLDLVFDKTTSEPVVEYITDGLTAHFSGYDDYVDGSWIDRVSGYKFTPVSTDTAPVHDGTNKLYEATQFGGMLADFKIAESVDYTFEFVARDLKNVVKAVNANNSAFIGTNLNGYTMVKGFTFYKLANNSGFWMGIKNANTSNNTITQHTINMSEFEDGGLDTFAVIPGVGFFRNGVKLCDCSNQAYSANVALFTHYDQANAGDYKAKGKIHAVRYYNRKLTAEEVLQNYNADISIYG